MRVALPPKQAAAPEPGATVKVQFPGLAEGEALHSVPLSAVVQRGEVSAVYVIEGSQLSLRQIRLGDRRDDHGRGADGRDARDQLRTK